MNLALTKKIWDISAPLDEHAAVFPGDVAYSQRLNFALGPDCPVNVHAITLSPHTGTHADAPLHYSAGGATAGELFLTPYLGPCRVIHVLGQGRLVQPADVATHLRHLPPRVLIRTRQVASQKWDDFSALAPELIELFASKGVVLVGLDTPSVDPAASKTLAAHAQLHRFDMRVLENLVLDSVPAGDYELIALPLKLMRSDASPVRAILREL